MDVYLPADFYRLRDDLHDWRDASSSDSDQSRKIDRDSMCPESRNDCADPFWRVF
jgi:hypothetical protein